MKKSLLIVATLFASVAVNAQIAAVDGSAIGLQEKGDADNFTDVKAGTTVVTVAGVEVKAAFDEPYQIVGANAPKVNDKNYDTVTFGDETVNVKKGIQGKNNPNSADGANPGGTQKLNEETQKMEITAKVAVPVSGAAFSFKAPASWSVEVPHYCYVIHKASSNKNYWVFEDTYAIGYHFAQATDGAGQLPSVYSYDLPVDANNYFDADNSVIDWAENYYLGDKKTADVKANGLGIIKFEVYGGSEYIFGAGGSKMTLAAIAFDEEGITKVAISQSEAAADPIVLQEAGESGIAAVAAAKAENGRMFNLAGQEVSKNFKGIVVVNGKKFMNK